MDNEKTIEQVLKEEGKLIRTTAGISMKPLFGDRRDNAIILPAVERLKKYDVALYKRGDEYVLHRVVKVLPDSYVICGDNCECYEYGIRDEDVIGYLYAFYRKDKYCSVDNLFYRMYSVYIVKSFRVRMLYRRVRRKASRLFRKMFNKK